MSIRSLITPCRLVAAGVVGRAAVIPPAACNDDGRGSGGMGAEESIAGEEGRDAKQRRMRGRGAPAAAQVSECRGADVPTGAPERSEGNRSDGAGART